MDDRKKRPNLGTSPAKNNAIIEPNNLDQRLIIRCEESDTGIVEQWQRKMLDLLMNMGQMQWLTESTWSEKEIFSQMLNCLCRFNDNVILDNDRKNASPPHATIMNMSIVLNSLSLYSLSMFAVEHYILLLMDKAYRVSLSIKSELQRYRQLESERLISKISTGH
jgi:hypothetical protein